jgi:Ring finger domain
MQLWVVMLLNSSELFVNQCTKSEFMDALEDVLNSQRTSPVVRKNLLKVLAAVAYASAGTLNKSESSFLVLWRKVKPAGKPDEASLYSPRASPSSSKTFLQAIPFDPDNTTINFPPLQQSTVTSTTPGDLPINPQLLQEAWPTDIDSILYAMRLEHEFDEENFALSAQRPKLDNSSKRLFECGVCMDEIPVDSIVRINSCGHIFCLGCLRGHVTARLDERRFPILCPTCTAAKGKGKGKIGGMREMPRCNGPVSDSLLEVPQSLVLNLGLTDEQFSIWTEMEMAPFSVLIHCRK